MKNFSLEQKNVTNFDRAMWPVNIIPEASATAIKFLWFSKA
jgi:hypothetical protein